jgi:hypothetical protein
MYCAGLSDGSPTTTTRLRGARRPDGLLLRAVPTPVDGKGGAAAPGWHGQLLEEIADWMESHEEWAALVPAKKAQLLERLHELFTQDGLDHLRSRAEQLWDSYELLDPILEVM